MTYYVVYVFDMAGLTGNVGLISSGIEYAIFIIGTAATFFFIDKTGRRPLLVGFLTNYLYFPSFISANYFPSDLRRNSHGSMYVRRRRHAGIIRYISSQRT